MINFYFSAGRSLPPTAPCGGDSRLSRSVFHGAFSAGDGDAAHPFVFNIPTMPSLDALPGIDYWGYRRIERTISPEAAGGALVGILLATPLGRIAAITASLGRAIAGPIGAHIAWYLGWAVAAYVSLLLIAHWNDLDEDTA